MRLWLSRHGEVPIREQLTTQIILGILCGELLPGQRLPSTKALSRKFDLHPNTISTGYQQLEREQWLEFKRGSGVYVRSASPQLLGSKQTTALLSLFHRSRMATPVDD